MYVYGTQTRLEAAVGKTLTFYSGVGEGADLIGGVDLKIVKIIEVFRSTAFDTTARSLVEGRLGDNDGAFDSMMEHSGIFNNIHHIQTSYH